MSPWCGTFPYPRRRKAPQSIGHGTGGPGTTLLDFWAWQVEQAFGESCWHVGSSVYRKSGWRDVDVRMIMDDERFDALFGPPPHATMGPRWAAMMLAFSLWGQKVTGLPIDFQIQRRSDVKESDWDKTRLALGMFIDPWRNAKTGDESTETE